MREKTLALCLRSAAEAAVAAAAEDVFVTGSEDGREEDPDR